MLLQSHMGELDLLPALPSAWPEGHVDGLRARGGFEIRRMDWQKGSLSHVEILSGLGGICRVRSNKATADFATSPGEVIVLDPELRRVR
jgi:alpha-L-fucosidase 2